MRQKRIHNTIKEEKEMAVNVKEIIDQVVDKAKSDPDFMKKLQSDPEKTIESVIGIDIPDGAVDQVLTAVKGKIALDKFSGVMDILKK